MNFIFVSTVTSAVTRKAVCHLRANKYDRHLYLVVIDSLVHLNDRAFLTCNRLPTVFDYNNSWCDPLLKQTRPCSWLFEMLVLLTQSLCTVVDLTVLLTSHVGICSLQLKKGKKLCIFFPEDSRMVTGRTVHFRQHGNILAFDVICWCWHNLL